MRPLDRQYTMIIGDNSGIAVQSFDSTAENYNPEFVAYLNAWQGLSKTYYTITEVEHIKALPKNDVVKPADYNVTSLDELRFFNGLSELPFRWSPPVESVIYPNSITDVSNQAWILNRYVKYFEIGNAVTTIQPYIFQTNTQPTTFVCRTAAPPVWVNTNGYSVAQRAICDLFVPAESIALYQQASVWNEFKSINAIDPSKKKQSL